MIVVEGPDGAGKSTLTRLLSERHGLPIAPRVVSAQANAMTDLKQWTEENTSKGFQEAIFDRHRLISDPIYRHALPDKKPAPDLYDLVWMTRMLEKFYDAEPVIIYCLPPLHVVQRNVLEGVDDNSVVLDHIEKIYYMYTARAAIDFVQHDLALIYDYRLSNFESISFVVKQALKRHRKGTN